MFFILKLIIQYDKIIKLDVIYLIQQQLPNNKYNYNFDLKKYNDKYILKKRSSGLGFFIFAYALSMQLLSMLIMMLLMLLCGINSDVTSSTSIPMQMITIFVSVFSVFVPGLLYLLFSKSSLSETIKVKYVKQGTLWPFVFIGMASAMVANVVANMVTQNFSIFGLQNTIEFDYSSNSPIINVLNIISVAIVPAFAEEFAFRGIVMGSLRKYGDSLAIIASAVMFGAMHGNISQIPFAFVLGLIFAFIDCKTNSIIPSIIIHFLNNFYAVTLDVFNSTGELSDRNFMIIYYIIIAAFCLLGVISFFVLLKKDKNFFKVSDKINNSPVVQTSLSFKEKITSFFINPGIILSLSIFVIETILFLGIL